MLTGNILAKAEQVLEACRDAEVMLATAESCTGGLIAGALTAIAGSSDVVERGFVTYTNEAKHEILGIPLTMIEAHGAVSSEVAAAMAEGALKATPIDLTVSVTGIAGPDGGTVEKPVGTVQIGVAQTGKPTLTVRCQFAGDRASVRDQTVLAALDLLLQRLRSAG